MLNKIVASILTWVMASVITPAMYLIYDAYRLKKENKALKKAIEDLKNAKTKTDIDIAIDNLP